MHVVHVTEAWNGGVATYINTLLRQQVLQDDISDITLLYDPRVATRDFDAAFYEAHNITLIPYYSSRSPKHIFKIAKNVHGIISGLSPKSGSTSLIVHLHSTFAGVYGRVFKSAGWKTVYCAHGWSFVQESGAFKKAIYGVVERMLARRTDAIINISAHEFEEARKIGIDAPIHEAILSGVDDASSQSDNDFLPDPKALNFGYIGRLDYKKGFDIAAQIFAVDDMRDAHLYVIGAANRDGHGSDIPASGNIHYLGWMDYQDLDGYIKKLDAVIIPSRQEGFGLSAVEAMRNGVPAIVSNRGGLPELITHGKDGFIFDLDMAAKDLPALIASLDKDKLASMGKAARKTFEQRFTASRFAADILRVYKRLL